MLILITGGQRSGKSKFAEKLLCEKSDVVYFATAQNNESDQEMVARILRHKLQRNSNWQTIECYKNFSAHIDYGKTYLLDCITNAVSRMLFDYSKEKEHLTFSEIDEVFEIIKNEFNLLIQTANQKGCDIFFVTNEVGSAVIPMHPIGRVFVDLQGMVNSFVAENCDCVYLCVSGIPVKIK